MPTQKNKRSPHAIAGRMARSFLDRLDRGAIMDHTAGKTWRGNVMIPAPKALRPSSVPLNGGSDLLAGLNPAPNNSTPLGAGRPKGCP